MTAHLEEEVMPAAEQGVVLITRTETEAIHHQDLEHVLDHHCQDEPEVEEGEIHIPLTHDHDLEHHHREEGEAEGLIHYSLKEVRLVEEEVQATAPIVGPEVQLEAKV